MIEVRRLSQSDNLAPILALCKDFFSEYQAHHNEFFHTDNLSDSDIVGRFRESIEANNSVTLIALSDGSVAGYASLAIREQPPFYKIKKIGTISALMVGEDYRRRGIATRIMEEAEIYFRRQGVKYYTFYTAVNNQAAIRLYEKLGLTPLHISFLGEL